MDIIRKVKPLKADFRSLCLKRKLTLLLVLVSLVTFLLPHKTFAVYQKPAEQPQLMFVVGDYQDYLADVSDLLTQRYRQEVLVQNALKEDDLNLRLKSYLAAQGSPLANYSKVLLSVKNWKQIVALANAESSLCRHYPKGLGNCWGVGGTDLWDMGETLGDSIIKMNKFLDNSPRKSQVKYSQMSFEQMNGLYKQPPADHWVVNNEVVFEELTELEQSL
jgi:hypothetical protein